MSSIIIKTNRTLWSNLFALQVKGEMCDTKLVGDNGSMMVHWLVLKTRKVWWANFRSS